ncbi:MAG: hypothetical protein WCX61_05275, partial [Candidatus Peribacteraceae bacterium]
VGNRQQYREHGPNVIFADYTVDSIMRSVQKALSPKFRTMLARAQSPYKGGVVARRTVKAIEQFLSTL